jgi:hypothetical protein
MLRNFERCLCERGRKGGGCGEVSVGACDGEWRKVLRRSGGPSYDGRLDEDILEGAESLISSDALCNDSQARRDGASHVVGGRGWGLKPSEVWSARDISAFDLCGMKGSGRQCAFEVCIDGI